MRTASITRKTGRFLSKQGQYWPRCHSKARQLSTHPWKMIYCENPVALIKKYRNKTKSINRDKNRSNYEICDITPNEIHLEPKLPRLNSCPFRGQLNATREMFDVRAHSKESTRKVIRCPNFYPFQGQLGLTHKMFGVWSEPEPANSENLQFSSENDNFHWLYLLFVEALGDGRLICFLLLFHQTLFYLLDFVAFNVTSANQHTLQGSQTEVVVGLVR